MSACYRDWHHPAFAMPCTYEQGASVAEGGHSSLHGTLLENHKTMCRQTLMSTEGPDQAVHVLAAASLHEGVECSQPAFPSGASYVKLPAAPAVRNALRVLRSNKRHRRRQHRRCAAGVASGGVAKAGDGDIHFRRWSETQREMLEAVMCWHSAQGLSGVKGSRSAFMGTSPISIPRPGPGQQLIRDGPIHAGMFIHRVNSSTSPFNSLLSCTEKDSFACKGHMHIPLYEMSFAQDLERIPSKACKILHPSPPHEQIPPNSFPCPANSTSHLFPHTKNATPHAYPDLFAWPDSTSDPQDPSNSYNSDAEYDQHRKIHASLHTPPPLKTKKLV